MCSLFTPNKSTYIIIVKSVVNLGFYALYTNTNYKSKVKSVFTIIYLQRKPFHNRHFKTSIGRILEHLIYPIAGTSV